MLAIAKASALPQIWSNVRVTLQLRIWCCRQPRQGAPVVRQKNDDNFETQGLKESILSGTPDSQDYHEQLAQHCSNHRIGFVRAYYV